METNVYSVNRKEGLEWRCHTPNLLKEIVESNDNMAIFSQPLTILSRLLYEVGERAAQLNDPELNKLMVKLTIYSCADPHSPDHDPAMVEQILNS